MRIALMLYGGIGGGFMAEGVPVVQQYAHRLGKHCALTVFSMLRPAQAFAPSTYSFLHAGGHVGGSVKWSALRLAYRFAQEHRRQPFDLLHVLWGYPAGFWGAWIARLFSLPFVLTLQGGEVVYLPEYRYGALGKKRVATRLQYAYKQAKRIICLSCYQKNKLPAQWHHKVQVLPWGVDIRHFAFKEKNIEYPLRFLHVANLQPLKRSIEALQFFEYFIRQTQIPARLDIVGDGSAVPSLWKYVQNEPLLSRSVHFWGHLSHKKLPAFYQEAHFFLHPSAYEAQGVVLAEAMASGAVVVSSVVGMAADLLNEHATFIPWVTHEALTQTILHMLNKPRLYVAMQQEARRQIELHFDQGKHMESMLKIYEQVLKNTSQ